jgi:hypothetical protein
MFSDEYAQLFYRQSKNTCLPDELAADWDALVGIIENGYNDVEPELANDLYLRQDIQLLIDDQELGKYGHEHQQFCEMIMNTDKKLKQLIFNNPFYSDGTPRKWWEHIILKKGGAKYYKEIITLYKIEIELIK